MTVETTDLLAIMRRDQRRRQMLNDPDLTGQTLLFALALDEVLANRKEQGRRSFRRWVHDVEELAVGHTPDVARRTYWAKRVIGDDLPRYEPNRDQGSAVCSAAMIRRAGACGKRATSSLVDRDPDTGEARWIGLCSRHREMRATFDARKKAWIANGKPSPAPNAGGVLKRYFVADWTAVYRWAVPYREALEGSRDATPPRPRLRLVTSGDAE